MSNESKEDFYIRPKKLDDYIGQEKIKTTLKVSIEASKKRNETLDHILFYGPPGLGKTTLANIVANEMGVNIKFVSAPSFSKIKDLASVLLALQPGDILFIDEIHALPRFIEEALYSALEDYKLSILLNDGYDSKYVSLDVPPFTLIGATTKIGKLSVPLKQRFGIIEKLNFYSINELNLIIKRISKVLETEIDEASCCLISSVSRSTPRNAIRIFKRIRDYAFVNNKDAIFEEDVKKALDNLKIFKWGLLEQDIGYLKVLLNKKDQCLGINSLSKIIGEENINLLDDIEPYLLLKGLIEINFKGRKITKKGINYLNCYKTITI